MGLFSLRAPSAPPPPRLRPTIEAVFRDELSFIVGALLHFGIPPEDAEAMAREVMPVIFQSLSRFDPSRPLRPWLFGVAFRQVKIRRRRERAHRTRFADIDMIDLADPSGTIEERMIQRETKDEMDRNVRAALAEIDLDRRAVLLARVVYEMSEEETAFALSIPPGTVKTRLRMAKQKLRQGIERREREQKWEQKRKTSALVLPLGALLANERQLPTVSPAMRARLWEQLQRVTAQPMISPWSTPPANDGLGPVAPTLPRLPLRPLQRLLDPEVGRVLGGAMVGGALIFAFGPSEAPAAQPTAPETIAALGAAPLASSPLAISLPAAVVLGVARAVGTTEAAAVPSAATEEMDPAAEGVLIHSAEMAFERNDIATARKLLEQHTREFRRSKLGTSRELLWIRILLREDKHTVAKAKADTLRKADPHSDVIKALDALFRSAEPSP